MPHAPTWRHRSLTADHGELIEANAITGCNTVSYPDGKSNISMLKTSKEGGTSLVCLTCWGGLCVSGRPHGRRGTVHRCTA